jgi:predicted dehydrogenase
MAPVRFAVIGTSRITERMLGESVFCPGFELAGVYSRSREKGAAFAGRYSRNGTCRVYGSLQELADDPGIDAVYVASPNACHAGQAVRMLESGKNVLCEKTLASNSREAETMFRAADAHGVLLTEGMRSIHTPGFRAVEENLVKLGTIRKARFSYCKYSSRYDAFRQGIPQNIFRTSCSAGALTDLGIYCIEPMVALWGKPARILSSSVMLPGMDGEDGADGAGTILAEYPGMTVELDYSKISDGYLPSEIEGEEGTMLIPAIDDVREITIRRRSTGTAAPAGADKEQETLRFQEGEADNLRYEIADFISAVRASAARKGQKAGVDRYRPVTLEAIRIADEVRRQCGIVFPADRDREQDSTGHTQTPAGQTAPEAEQGACTNEKH